MGRTPSASIVCAALSLAASACGGGADPSGGETLSTAEFRQQADATCLRFGERIEALGDPSSPEEFLDYTEKALPLLEEGHGQLRQLTPPADLAETWNKGLAINDQIDGLLRELRDAVEDGDLARAQEIKAQIESKDVEAGRLAREVGLTECG